MNCWKTYLLLMVFFAAGMLNAQPEKQADKMPGALRDSHIREATKFRKDGAYAVSIIHLDSILALDSTDAPVLLFRGDLLLESKRYAEAVTTYSKLLPLDYERTITRINLSYALFMKHQPSKALYYAEMAWTEDQNNTRAIVNYFNALLWNAKTKRAASFLETQQESLSPSQVLVLRARLYTASGNFSDGLTYYDSLVDAYPDKYCVLEYAEVLLGKQRMKKASEVLAQHAQYFSSSELRGFTEKIEAASVQQAGTEFTYFRDNGENVRIESIGWWQQSDLRRFQFGVRAGFTRITSANENRTNTQFLNLSLRQRWSNVLSGRTELLLQRIQPLSGKGYVGFTGKQTIRFQPNDRRMFGVYYSADILNYTATLLQMNLRSQSVGYVTHIMFSGKTGFYSEGSWSALTDGNRRWQFFGSAYYLFRTNPTIKVGYNFSALHFKNDTVVAYFSPNRYISNEIFADFMGSLPGLPRFFLQLQTAAGAQKIEQQRWDPAFRLDAELSYNLPKFKVALRYRASNVASDNGSGYKFNWMVVRLVWKW